jgi:CheY-like chemotaxis protein
MPASLSSASARSRRVLIVDDYADAAESLALLLNLAGYDATTATDGKTANGPKCRFQGSA